MAIVHERIKALRSQNGLTLATIADRLGVTEATAQRYETGKGIKAIPYEVIEKYANIFNCSPSYLMGWEQDKIDAAVKLQQELSDLEDAIEEEIKTRLSCMSTEELEKINEILGFELSINELCELLNYAKFIVSKRK